MGSEEEESELLAWLSCSSSLIRIQQLVFIFAHDSFVFINVFIFIFEY
jgi:hypothetical protein